MNEDARRILILVAVFMFIGLMYLGVSRAITDDTSAFEESQTAQ